MTDHIIGPGEVKLTGASELRALADVLKFIPDHVAVERFLAKLDPTGGFTFQAIDDNKERKDKSLARILHGSIKQHGARLCQLNAEGAGIFVTINATDGKGREIKNVVRIRAVFVDLDGAPLPA
jgi:hypothetical protein